MADEPGIRTGTTVLELAVDFADVSEKFKAAKSAASGLFKRFRGR